MSTQLETFLTHWHIYSFDSTTNHLPCLAHVLNLVVIDVMGVITCIAMVKTTTAIWEYDPTLTNNHVMDNSLDVIVAVHTLAIKIQSSGQWIVYFERLQKDCGINIPLKIPLHSNVHWGIADGMLGQSYQLRQVSTDATRSTWCQCFLGNQPFYMLCWWAIWPYHYHLPAQQHHQTHFFMEGILILCIRLGPCPSRVTRYCWCQCIATPVLLWCCPNSLVCNSCLWGAPKYMGG